MEKLTLKERIELQVGFQMSRDQDQLLDHYTEVYTEALEWVLAVIKEMECADDKVATDDGLEPATRALMDTANADIDDILDGVQQ